MSDYSAILDWVKTEVDTATLDHSSKGAHLTDDVVNADTSGHAHVEEPEDYREVEGGYTGGEYVNYYVDIRFRVAGDEAATSAKVRAFADTLRAALHQSKDVITGVTHHDTELIFTSSKSGEWHQSKLERDAHYRVRVLVSEDNPA